MTRLFREAEVVVSTCGYNTMAEILTHAKRAIVVPRVLHRKEQLLRARRMDELGLATCIPPDEITPERLFETLQRVRAGEPTLERAREQARVPLNGADEFANFCAELSVSSPVSQRRQAQ